ncbi:Molybdopterin molybdenumtransferase [Crenothrix polyspora]|uniref:Molybdopterin molybdenumtransferase n=1 Tax=Crenothrix polyspora TaxID=360316 RepID=A0A1R4HHG5_9GAMM|nr:gephyrin-like molybdotransferase Glp [Crenothrix polyspora]SJM95688.1 Molybdopterin molybdenumtransferase [Crenothrix polyspora]
MLDACAPKSKPLLTIPEALEKIRLAIQPIQQSETVALNKALGRILAEPIYSPINMPFDRNSAMDGYAFASTNKPGQSAFTLECVGTSWAGRPFQGQLQKGQCVRIFTGAVLPPETDSVIMQEKVQVDGNTILFPEDTKIHQNVREVGEDVEQGRCLISPPKKLTVPDISLLASVGVAEVIVKRALKVAFFSTGDELVPLDQPLTSGKIYDSNRYTLQSLLADVNITATDMGIIPDDKQLLEDSLVAASKAYDIVITTGGASVGEADYVKEILEHCGEVNFWKIAIKPGKPLAFGKIGASYFFGLPGNPVSVMATFQQIVAPALRQLAGESPSKALRITATCNSLLKKAAGRQDFQRGILTQDDDGNFLVVSSGVQGSNILSSLSRANCYIVLPSECTGVNVGEKVIVEPFSLLLGKVRI